MFSREPYLRGRRREAQQEAGAFHEDSLAALGGEEAEDDRGGGADALINRLISADRLAQSPDMGQTTENCELVQPRTTVHTVHALGAPIVGAGRRRGQHRQHGRRHVLRRLRRLAQMQAVAGLVELATRAQRSE